MEKSKRMILKTVLCSVLCGVLFILTGYFYFFEGREEAQNEVESVPYYSPLPDSAGILFDILGDKTFFYLDFEQSSLSVIYADEIESEADEIFGYPVDYTISSDFSLLGGIVDGVGGIDLEIGGERLALTGVQVIEIMEKTVERDELRRNIVDEVINKISSRGFDREQFLYIIENSDTDLTVPDCYYWAEHMKEICKLPRTVN